MSDKSLIFITLNNQPITFNIMTTNQEKIKALTLELLETAKQAMEKDIETAIKCGGLDIEGWNECNQPMFIPRIILTAVLQAETYRNKFGGAIGRQIARDVKKVKYCL